MMLSPLPAPTTRPASMRRCRPWARAAALLALFVCLIAAVETMAADPERAVAPLELVWELDVGALGLDRPSALAVDDHDRFYVVDGGNDRVLIVAPDGSLERELGGYGWGEDRLAGPLDIAVDPGIASYVLDWGNRRVVEYDAEGDYLGVVLDEALLGEPMGLDFGSGGELLVADADAQLVRVFSQFGEPLDPIGSFGGEAGGLVGPTRVAMGPGREVAVSDPLSSEVKLYDEFGSLLVTMTTGASFAPAALVFDPLGRLAVADPVAGTVSLFDCSNGSLVAAVGRDALGPSAAPTGLAIDRTGRLLVLAGPPERILAFALEYDDR